MSVFASRPLVFSALLHASAAGLLLVLMLRMQREPVSEPFIVDWVPVAAPAPSVSDTRTPAPAVNFNPVRVAAPVRTPVTEDTVTETQAQPRAVVRTTPAAQPGAARTTITEHRRRNPGTAAPAITAAPAHSSPRARINMDDVLAAEPGSVRARPAVAADPAQAAAYWDRLLGKLRAAHEKPAGLDDGLVVRVEFMLRADGTVGDVRVLASSGSAEFDASVVAAFRRLSGLGPPPASKAGLNHVTFRTRAE